MIAVIVKRGVVHVPDLIAVGEQRRINALNFGFGGRTGQHLKRYGVGERVVLPRAEAARLLAAGIVELIA